MFDLIQIAFFGGAVGILCGLIPGVGMLVAIAMLYPILLGLQPVELLMFYTCMVCSAQYFGSITAIYLGIAGEASSFPAVVEGYSLSKQGSGQRSIFLTGVGSFVGTMFGLLFAYKTGIIKPDKNFMLMVFAGTFAIFALYLVNFIMMFFGASIGFIHSNGLFGIGFSLLVVCIAALNLVLDFDYIEQGAENNAPKYLEWYGAFSLMVTLIWLYLEILRLLSKLRSR